MVSGGEGWDPVYSSIQGCILFTQGTSSVGMGVTLSGQVLRYTVHPLFM